MAQQQGTVRTVGAPEPTTPVPLPTVLAARVAGLPVALLEALSTLDTATAVERVLDQEDDLRRRATTLSDRLYAVIGGVSGARRGRLVGLRRALHNLRAPSPSEWDDEVQTSLPRDLRAAVAAWLHDRRRLDEACHFLERACASADDHARDAIAMALEDHGFALALLEANATLWEQSHRSGPGGAKRRARLARFVNRAASKTSPRTWLGTWTTARLDPQATHLCWEGSIQRRSVLEPNLYVLSRWTQRAAGHPAVSQRLPLAPVPGIARRGGTLRFANHDGDIVRMRQTPAVDTVLELARATITHGALVEELSRHVDNPEEAEAFVAAMRAAGLLEVRFPLRPGQDVLDGLVEGWGSAVSVVPELAVQLERWLRLAKVTAEDRAPARATRLASPDLDSLRDDPSLPLLWEDTILATSSLRVPARLVREAATELAALPALFGLFDLGLENRRGLVTLWDRHLGDRDEVPLLELYETAVANRDELDAFAKHRGQPWAAEIRRRQDALFERWDERNNREVVFQARDVTDALAEVAGDVETPAWTVLHTQVADYDDDPLLVVNDVFRGARATAKVARLIERAGGNAPAGLAVQPKRDPDIFLDILTPFDSNLGLRAGGTNPVLMVPGGGVEPPSGRAAVDPAELVVRRSDPVCELWWPEAGRRVRMHPTGMVSELWMPPLAAFVMLYFSFAPAKPPFLRRWAERCLESPDQPLAFPRVVLGGRVVLERRTHVLDLRTLPLAGHDRPAEALTALNRVLRDHDVDRRCFVRVVDLERFARGARGPGARGPYKARKPLFMDLGSPVWLDQLGRLASDESATHVIFQEALPDPSRHPPGPDGHTRVTELLLELVAP